MLYWLRSYWCELLLYSLHKSIPKTTTLKRPIRASIVKGSGRGDIEGEGLIGSCAQTMYYRTKPFLVNTPTLRDFRPLVEPLRISSVVIRTVVSWLGWLTPNPSDRMKFTWKSIGSWSLVVQIQSSPCENCSYFWSRVDITYISWS